MTEGRSLLCPTLIGRDREVGTVRDIVEARTTARVATVVGEAGVGKSALVAAAIAGSSRRTFAGRATPGGLALRALAEVAVAAVVAGARVDDRELGPLRAGLGALLPGTVDATLDGATFPLVAAEALLCLIATLDVPVTLVLDDLHWADAESLEALERICDRVATRAVTVLLVTRPGCPAERLARRVASRRLGPLVDLRSLNRTDAVAMAERCLGATVPDGLPSLIDGAGGNPFLIEELLRSASDVGALVHDGHAWSFDPGTPVAPPSTLAESVALRLDQLPGDAGHLLSVAASLGEGQPMAAVLAAASVGPDDERRLLDAIRAGIASQLLDPASADIRFRHALTAEAAAAALLPHERMVAAGKALDALTSPGTVTAQKPALLAGLAERAGRRDAAAQWWLDDARQHARGAATGAAIASVERALALAEDASLRAEARIEHVELLALAGRSRDAVAAADVAAATPNLTSDGGVRLDMARARCMETGPARQAAMRRALDAAAGSDREPKVEATAALLAVEQGDHESAAAHATRALQLSSADPTARCQALEVLGRVARSRDLDQAAAYFSEAAATAEAHGLALWRARALHERATITQLRDVDTADLELARLAALDAGAPGLIATIDFHLAAVLATRFDAGPALLAARRFLDLGSAVGGQADRAWGWTLVGYANVVAGRHSNAEAALAEAARLGREDLEVGTLNAFFRSGLTHLLGGDPSAAVDGYQQAMRALAATPTPSSLPPWYLGPLLCTVLDRDGATYRRLADRPGLQLTATIRGTWLMAEAVAAGNRGATSGATELAAQAAHVWADRPGLDAHRHIAQWLAAPAAHACGWGQPDTWLFEAEAWAREHGFSAIADSCRSRLRMIGAPLKRRRGTTAVPVELERQGITSREIDVLALVGAGLTNAAIAERLHLSPGTVKGYVSHLLAKAAAPNRAALARIAARHGLDREPAG